MLHLLGIIALARILNVPWGFAVVALAAIAVAVLALYFKLDIDLSVLAPLFFPYAILAARFSYVRLLGGVVGAYYDYEPPRWELAAVHVQAGVAAACILIGLIVLRRVVGSRSRAVFLASVVLAGLTLAWSAWDYLSARTAGATGSDPYAYVQMGVDLALHGSPAHRFSLFPQIVDSDLPWYPLVHVGYRLPFDRAGDAVSVWPPGGSLAYAAAFRLAGEPALYLVNPLFSFLSVLCSAAVAWELARWISSARRALVSGGTAALVATANEQVVWAGITMVDAQAELWSLAAVYLALRARRSESIAWPVLAGLALGAAYDVRHTQLVLALPLLIAFYSGGRCAGWWRLFLAATAALVVALPDLWYHQVYLGNWLTPESEELANFSLQALALTPAFLAFRLFAGFEFGWLLPFLAIGIVQLARRARLEFWLLCAWLGAAAAVHSPYSALRLRDLLPEIAVLALICAIGLATSWEWLVSRRRPLARMAAAGALLLSFQVLVLRVWNTVPAAADAIRPSFGYMTRGGRSAFDELAAETPAKAIVGAGLNSGAVDLYAGRETFRPEDWTDGQNLRFVRELIQSGRPVYFLVDSAAVENRLEALRGHCELEETLQLEVPLFPPAPAHDPGSLWSVRNCRE